MAMRIALAVLLGGSIGLAVGMVGKALGGQCPIACNPYVSTGLGVFVGLILASSSRPAEALLTSPRVVHGTSQADYDRAISAPAAIVVYYTQHCPACHEQLPVVNELADKVAENVLVLAADAAKMSGPASADNVTAVPTTIVFRGGRQVAKFEGLATEQDLLRALEGEASQP